MTWPPFVPVLRSGIIFALLLVLNTGCSHVVREEWTPPVQVQPAWSLATKEGQPRPLQWWTVFNDPLLDNYIQLALIDNLDLKAGLARLKQARLTAIQAGSHRYPGLKATAGADREWKDNGDSDSSDSLRGTLSWEIDLWGRLAAAAAAADLDAAAEAEALHDLSLQLSIEVADTYYQLIEQALFQDLLQRQLEANQTSLDLIKLRFANGAASLVDVYQQEDLVASVRAQLPPVTADIVVLRNRLRILLGLAPDSGPLELAEDLPDLPPPPELGVPADLLLNRPDLRELQRSLAAADQRVAEAVADRLPSLTIGATTALDSGTLLLTTFGDAMVDLVDGGNKRAEVAKNRAKVEEELAGFGQAYLTAVQEVENNLWRERQQQALLTALDEQLRFSRATLDESRNRYMQGITDYLPVLSALVSQQRLERSILVDRRDLLSYRLQLYQSLGGSPLPPESLSQPDLP